MNVFPCTFESIIGEGGFGIVYKAVTPGGIVVAVKEVRVDNEKKALIEREIEVMSKLNHPNIVRYLGSMYKEGKYYIALEYCKGGDLESYLKSVGKVNKQIVLFWFKQLISAFSYLQLNNYMHRDIKPANLFLNSLDPGSADIKIGDFGFSKNLINNLAYSKLGTPLYMAPEVFTENSYDYRADVWSLGCVIYELIEGTPIYDAKSIQQLINMQKSPPKFSDKFTQLEAEFIQYMVRYYISDRPDFIQLENSYFIKNIQKPILHVQPIEKKVDNSPILLLIDKKMNDLIRVLFIFEDIIYENPEMTYFFVAYLEFRCSVFSKKLGSLKPQNFENREKEEEFEEIERKLSDARKWIQKFKDQLTVPFEEFKVNSGSLAEFINYLIPMSYEYEDIDIQILLIDICKYFDQANELLSERYTYLQSMLNK